LPSIQVPISEDTSFLGYGAWSITKTFADISEALATSMFMRLASSSTQLWEP